MSKKNDQYITTPPLEFKFTHLDQPDSGRSQSDDKYKVSVVLDPEEHSDLVAKLLKINEAHCEIMRAEHPDAEPYTVLKQDKDRDRNETGKYLWTPKSKFPVALIDAQNQPIPEGTRIPPGSVGQVNVKMTPTSFKDRAGATAGSTCYLQSVRVISLANTNAFGDPVEGYTYTPPANQPQPEHEFAGDFRNGQTNAHGQAAYIDDDSELPF